MDKEQNKTEIDDYEDTQMIGAESISTASENLLDMPEEIIEMFLDHLNLTDRLNFALTCKKVNGILSKNPKYWRNVWFKIQKSQKVSDLTRPYVNISWGQDKSSEEVWRFLAPSIKKLVIGTSGEEEKKLIEFSFFLDQFDAALPHLANLRHLEINQHLNMETTPSELFYLSDFDTSMYDHVVEMGKLEYLQIDFSLMVLLQKEFAIKFSSNNLKVLKLDGTYAKKGRNFIANFIAQQKNLQVLHLDGYFDYIFDDLAKLDHIQLKEIHYFSHFGQSDNEQNNFVKFLESQKKLEFQYVESKRVDITPRMLNYQMNLLNSPSTALKLLMIPRQFQQKFKSNEYNSADFSNYPHRTNLVTQDLEVKFIAVTEPDIMVSLCTKFPNLKRLNLEILRVPNVIPFNLQPLESLESLESFDLVLESWLERAVLDSRILIGVTLPNLKSFGFDIDKNYLKEVTVNAEELKSFLALHKKITHLKIESKCFFEDKPSHVIGYLEVLKYAVEILPELMTIESVWCESQQTAEELNDLVKVIKIAAKPGFSMKLRMDMESCFFKTITKTTKGEIVMGSTTAAQKNEI